MMHKLLITKYQGVRSFLQCHEWDEVNLKSWEKVSEQNYRIQGNEELLRLAPYLGMYLWQLRLISSAGCCII